MANKAGGSVLFHDAIETTGNGTTFYVHEITTMNIGFTISEAGTFTANFEGQIQYQGAWLPIKTANISTLVLATTATDATSVYQIDTTGFETIRVRISALSGTLSCYGKGVF